MERNVKNIDYYVDSIFKSFNTRLPKVKEEVTAIKKEIGVQNQAYNRYIFEANKFAKSTGLKSSWTKAVRNGTINYSDYSQENAENIKKYQEMYEKALACKDAVQDLQASVAELYKTYADLTIAKYEGKINRAKFKQDLLETYQERAEIFGYQGSKKYNDYQITLETAIRDKLEKQRTELRNNLKKAVNSGYMSTNSEQYNEMQAQIDQLSLDIAECTNNIYEFEYANRQLTWDRWDYYANAVAKIAEETQWFVDILADSPLFDDNGKYTDKGMATLGLHGISYNIDMQEVATYGRAIADINEEINKSTKNKSDVNLLNRRDELIKQQREYITSAQKEKEAVKSLVEEGINSELDALDKLIDKYTEALDSQKDLYDYQKNVKKQTQELASLQKQLMVYTQMDTDEGRLKSQQLRKSIKEAEENLQETEYERFISDQKKMLEQMYEDYEETLNKKLDDTDTLIEEVIASVNNNSSEINTTLTAVAASLGYATSDELKSIISSNGEMLKTYNGERQDKWGAYMSNTDKHYTNVETVIGDIGRYIKMMYAEYDRYAGVNVTNTKNMTPVGQKATGDRFIDHDQLAWTQENGVGEAIIRPSDNAILTPLKYGDSVLNGSATNSLFDFANNPSDFIKAHLSGGTEAVIPVMSNQHSIDNYVNLDVILPNVQNYDQFLEQMRNDKRFAKLIEALTADGLSGKLGSSKFKINI